MSSQPRNRPVLVVPGPTGEPFTQAMAAELSRCSWLVFACGRYEGIDARVVEDARLTFDVREVSLGDYVLAGGEVAALVVIEAVTRLLPGVLGNDRSADDDSFAPGRMAALLEGPGFTKPRSWRGHDVPPLLVAGDHARVKRWRRDEAIRRTALVRPDLLSRLDPAACDDDDLRLLTELGWTAVAQGFSPADRPVAD
jgi:tRNA (guanine37-N1)-methyltransferase